MKLENLSLTVIVPTFNRSHILKKCLDSLISQDTDKSDYEIIVVDDGSSDGTPELVKSITNTSRVSLSYYRQENKGPAAARNLAIRNSKGRILLFLGDDIITAPSLIKEHLNSHNRYREENLAVLGKVVWSKEVQRTPFIRFLDKNDVQFCHPLDSNPVRESCKYFYSSNVSLKKNLLMGCGFFDEDFKYAACEDIELGYRLQKQGMLISYNEMAVGFHCHSFTLKEYCRRMSCVGKSIVILSRKHPEGFPIKTEERLAVKEILKKTFYPLIMNLVSFLDYNFGINFHSWYARLLEYYKSAGIKGEIIK